MLLGKNKYIFNISLTSNISVIYWCVTNYFKHTDLKHQQFIISHVFLGASAGHTWILDMAVFIWWFGWSEMTSSVLGLTWDGWNGWDGWNSLSTWPFILESSKCDLRVPREPAPTTNAHQAPACVKCADVSLTEVSHMTKQRISVVGDYTGTWK